MADEFDITAAYAALDECEPYTVGFIYLPPWSLNGKWFRVYYRTYSRRQTLTLTAKDELDAYIQGQNRLNKLKRKWHLQNRVPRPEGD